MAFWRRGFCSPNAAVGFSNWISRKLVGVSSLIRYQKPIVGHPNSNYYLFGDCGTMSLHSYSKPKNSSPWLMLPPTLERASSVYQFYSLAENKVMNLLKGFWPRDDAMRVVGSSHGWLAFSNEHDPNMFLYNPLSRRRVELPPLHRPVDSIIISSSTPDQGDGRAMILYCGSLAFCCPGKSTEWTPLGDLTSYSSFVYSIRQKLFFCCCTDGDEPHFEAWDLEDPLSPRVIPMVVSMVDRDNYPVASRSKEEFKYKCQEYKFLVVAEPSDQLFHVRRFVMECVGTHGYYAEDAYYGPKMGFDESVPYRTVDFDVHKYDPETRSLEYMDRSLDGLALFIGCNNGFALSPSQFPELKPNSIYYTSPPQWVHDHYTNGGGHDVGIFDYQDQTLCPCFYPCDLQSVRRFSAPMWCSVAGERDGSTSRSNFRQDCLEQFGKPEDLFQQKWGREE